MKLFHSVKGASSGLPILWITPQWTEYRKDWLYAKGHYYKEGSTQWWKIPRKLNTKSEVLANLTMSGKTPSRSSRFSLARVTITKILIWHVDISSLLKVTCFFTLGNLRIMERSQIWHTNEYSSHVWLFQDFPFVYDI